MRQIKQTYLLFLIVIGLISLSVYSTYALFTASFEITDVVDLQATLQTENDFFEYESISIPAGATKTVEVNVSNDDTAPMYYGIWYEILNATDTSKVSVGLYSDADDTLSSGQIPPGKTFTALVGIKNKGSSAVIVNLGSVGSKTSNLGIESPKKLLSNDWKPVPPATQTLTRLGLAVNSDTPDFSKTSCSTGCDEATVGIYASEDDLGTSYYFRGNVVNNYVKFGKNASNQDMYWRIIRINGDGSVRMIYDGTSAHANGESSTDRQVGTSAFNEIYDDNTYVGYMIGTPGVTATGQAGYNATHSNSTDSTMKTYLEGDGTTSNEGWYKDNIIDTGYEEYVADAIYCNDRSLSTAGSYTGIGNSKSYYGAYQRNITNKSPSLICNSNNNNADKFTTTTSLGNGKNKYPVGLITADEVAYAGGKNGTENSKFYLYTGNYFWAMSPYLFNGSNAGVFDVSSSGDLDVNGVGIARGVRPVVSLKSNVLQYGSGSPLDPFRVE